MECYIINTQVIKLPMMIQDHHKAKIKQE